MTLINKLLTFFTLRYSCVKSSLKMHSKCLGEFYPRTQDKVKRTKVDKDMVEWSCDFPNYRPTEYTASFISAGASFADSDLGKSFSFKWNEVDGNINRISHEGNYEIIDRKPRNPHGRTGISGRGCLGKWGPNHAADPVVTRWKLNGVTKVLNDKSKLPILEFVSIQRKDCEEWAIPGGMVDPGEKISATLKREFMEEALNSLQMESIEREKAEKQLDALFSKGKEIYAGYVDDPRNTDNAWMETVVYNFHEDDPEGVLYKINLKAGDDAGDVTWMEISSDLNLYASHKEFIEKIAKFLGAHW